MSPTLGVLARMKATPREFFVDQNLVSLAYSDACLTVTGASPRELTAPLILARLLKEAHIRAGERVLVVAGASGYAAALIAGLAGSVVSLDNDEKLTELAQGNFAALGLANAKAVTGPLELGAPAEAPFDLILVDGVSQGNFEFAAEAVARRWPSGRHCRGSTRRARRNGDAVSARRRPCQRPRPVRRFGGRNFRLSASRSRLFFKPLRLDSPAVSFWTQVVKKKSCFALILNA